MRSWNFDDRCRFNGRQVICERASPTQIFSMAMGFDVDMDALRICRSNIESMELESSCNILQMDVLQMRNHTHFDRKFSILLSNPPFGCQNNNGRLLKKNQTNR